MALKIHYHWRQCPRWTCLPLHDHLLQQRQHPRNRAALIEMLLLPVPLLLLLLLLQLLLLRRMWLQMVRYRHSETWTG